MSTKGSLRIGQLLIEEGIVSPEDIEKALREQKKSGKFLCTVLIEMGLVQEDSILPVLAKQMSLSFVKIKSLHIEPQVISKVPAKFAIHYKLMPIKLENNTITIAVTDQIGRASCRGRGEISVG